HLEDRCCGVCDERLDAVGVLRCDRAPSRLEGLPEVVRGIPRGTKGKTLRLDVGVLDGEREHLGIQRPVSAETCLERLQIPDLIAIGEVLKDPLYLLYDAHH